jgi:3-hydroxyisobutyrate dehydrogenase-like beta-hydroxyacid dehydrogenase
MNQDIEFRRIGLIGYGEVGKIFADALIARGVGAVVAYDRLVHDPARGAEMKAHAQRAGVRMTSSVDDMLAETELVISAVTASETRNAALAACPSIRKGAFYLDINSASPKTKAECGDAVEAAGARYVEAAVMTSVPPYGIRVPMLLGGPHAGELAPRLAALGFAATPVSETLGVASAIKMCRSVIIKGMEAIVIESYLCARKHGVEQQVLDSLAETFPGIDWEKQGTYFFSRVVQHGRRRAEEMREAAAMVAEAGFAPFMAAATAERHAWVATWAADDPAATSSKLPLPWREVADRMIRAQKD